MGSTTIPQKSRSCIISQPKVAPQNGRTPMHADQGGVDGHFSSEDINAGGHAVPPHPPPPPHLTKAAARFFEGRIRIVLCEPRAHRHQRNSRIPASGAPRRFLWCRFRARLPASSPDPAPKQQPAAQWPRHRPCTQPNRQIPHPYFFATLPPRRFLLLRGRGHWGGSPLHRLRCICASVDRTRAARSAFIENHLRKRMARTMVRSWTRKHSPPDKRPPAQNAVGALSCALSALEN